MTEHFADPVVRRQLRAVLVERHPWLGSTEIGPRAVEAGECDRCGVEPRLVTTCGPSPWAYLGRRCATAVGEAAWCDGHQTEGTQARAALAILPPEADAAARLWWVATGEIRVDPDLAGTWRRAALAPPP